MEFLKAWIWTQQKLRDKGEPSADLILVKYVENLLNSMQSLLDTKFVKRTKSGNFELAEIADLQVENRILKDCIDECLSLVCQRDPQVLNHKQAADAVQDIMLKTLEKINVEIQN